MTEDRNHSPADDAADARIDAIARSAGRELRRPAPANGIAKVQRARRTRQVTRAAGGGVAAIVLVAVGVVALNNRDSNDLTTVDSVAITQPQVSTTADPNPPATDPSTPPAPTSLPVDSTTSLPTTSLPAVEIPAAVYVASGSVANVDRVQVLIDPSTGQAVGYEPVDVERSQAAQEALPRGGRSSADLGDVAYHFMPVSFDAGTLATDVFPDVDLCMQNVVNVRSSAGSALPTRARFVLVTPDDRFVITLSSNCPEAGTMGADGVGTSLPYDIEVQVFDAEHPELAGRTLGVLPSSDSVSAITASANGRFVAIETFADGLVYRVFDLESGQEVDLDIQCPYVGANYSRFIGPWVGASSMALGVQCADESRLLIRDLMPDGGQLEVAVPNVVDRGFLTVEVDHAHYAIPEGAWFNMCDLGQTRCWIGHANDPLVEVADVSEASFLPLGYYPGG